MKSSITFTIAFICLLSSVVTAHAQISDSLFRFRNTLWGMTSSEVKESEKGKGVFVRKEKDSLYPLATSHFYTTTMAGIPVEIDYRFFNDSLYEVFVQSTRKYWKDPAKGVSDFYILWNSLNARYDTVVAATAENDRDYRWQRDTIEALRMGVRDYDCFWFLGEGKMIILNYERAGDEDDVDRPKEFDLWFAISNEKHPLSKRLSWHIEDMNARRATERREAAEREAEKARADGEKNAVDF